MYRKALVEEPAFKIILGVLALVILAALLLRVPGLSEKVFGFLGEKFDEGVTEGKALHIWTDPFTPSDEKITVFEFHLTNDKRHPSGPSQKGIRFDFFYLDSFPENLCTIYTTDDGGNSHQHSGYIYYVNPGSLIQFGKDSVADGISIADSGCVRVVISETGLDCAGRNCKKYNGEIEENYPCAGKYNLVKCEHSGIPNFYCEDKVEEGIIKDEYVINKNFRTSNVNWKCKESKCNLLVEKTYQVKYGLICDIDGKWKACTEKKAEAKDRAGPEGLECQESDERGIFIWGPPK